MFECPFWDSVLLNQSWINTYNLNGLCLFFRHVKVYNTTNYKVVHNFDYAASILSLALAVRNKQKKLFFNHQKHAHFILCLVKLVVAQHDKNLDFYGKKIFTVKLRLCLSFQPEDKSIVVGMTNNILNIKHRKNPEESKEVTGQQRRHPSYRVFVKGKNYVPKQVSECCGCDQQIDSRCVISYQKTKKKCNLNHL